MCAASEVFTRLTFGRTWQMQREGLVQPVGAMTWVRLPNTSTMPSFLEYFFKQVIRYGGY